MKTRKYFEQNRIAAFVGFTFLLVLVIGLAILIPLSMHVGTPATKPTPTPTTNVVTPTPAETTSYATTRCGLWPAGLSQCGERNRLLGHDPWHSGQRQQSGRSELRQHHGEFLTTGAGKCAA